MLHTVGLSAMKGKIVLWNGRDTTNSIIVVLKAYFWYDNVYNIRM